MIRFSSSRGVALVITLLAISLLSALAFGLSLSSSVNRLANSNHRDSVALLNAAEAGLALASKDLAAIDDWSRVLAGSAASTFVDGSPGARARPGGLVIDIPTLTNELTCGLPTSCSDAQMRESTAERPWGVNNPRWQPFLHAALDDIAGFPTFSSAYVIVWIGDDGRERDDDALADGAGPEREGRHLVRARAEAFGVGGARRALEAELLRVCPSAESEGEDVCLPGIRVQSWRLVSAAAP
jgi:hypothetical protein